MLRNCGTQGRTAAGAGNLRGVQRGGWAARGVLVVVCLLVWMATNQGAGARAATASIQKLTFFTDQLAGPPLLGLGAELDPYDTVAPTQMNWSLLTQRLAFMKPGFLRVVEPASTYFGG